MHNAPKKTPAPIVARRDAQTGNYLVTLEQEMFTGEALALPSSGYFLDVLALSAKQWEENELWENCIDNFSYTHSCIVDEFDWESAYLDALNAGSAALAPMSPANRAKAYASDLLPGAYFALNHPDDFAEGLKTWRGKIEEQAHEYVGEYSTDCEALNKKLMKAYNDDQDELRHAWLHGDRDTVGMLEEARKYHDFESVDLLDGKGKPERLLIEVTAEWIAERLGLDDPENPAVEQAAAEVMDSIVYSAKRYVEARRADREQRAKRYAEQRAREKAREEEKQKAREARLLSMKKA